MKNKKIHEPYNLPTLNDFFERTHGSYMGRVEKIDINRIENFKNHPFKVKDDGQMENLVESIKENGVLNPILVRPTKDNKFEIVSGHRRKRAVELADIGEIPCIVRELTDDEATILMVDSNLQREEILPSEKACAYKMKMEISYKKVDDYYIPEMVFPNAKLDKNIGKYGRLRLNFLKHNHIDIYTILLMDNKLNEHLLEVEKETKEQVKRLVDSMCKKENVTEELKEKNQMEWVRLMNNFKIIAEEIVMEDLIFC